MGGWGWVEVYFGWVVVELFHGWLGVSGSGWRYILDPWRRVDIFIGEWEWVEVYFGWVEV